MKEIIITSLLLWIYIPIFAQDVVDVHNTNDFVKAIEEQKESLMCEDDVPSKNNCGAKLRESNFHLGLDIQTKYVWRGMEMLSADSAPVLFPGINYQWQGLYVYAMGGYAINGKYAEVDMGISYTWKGLTVGFNDYYYPTLSAKQDEYFTGGKRTGHWLEACATYTPEKVPIWLTISNFFYGYDKDRAYDGDGNEISAKQAYSTYFEIGTYYDFLDNNRISLAVGVTPSKSCYSDYQKKMALCNIDLKYSYNVKFKSGWTVPLSTEFIYNPVFDKPFINFIVNLAF